jgi:hypothetical protein
VREKKRKETKKLKNKRNQIDERKGVGLGSPFLTGLHQGLSRIALDSLDRLVY